MSGGRELIRAPGAHHLPRCSRAPLTRRKVKFTSRARARATRVSTIVLKFKRATVGRTGHGTRSSGSRRGFKILVRPRPPESTAKRNSRAISRKREKITRWCMRSTTTLLAGGDRILESRLLGTRNTFFARNRHEKLTILSNQSCAFLNAGC